MAITWLAHQVTNPAANAVLIDTGLDPRAALTKYPAASDNGGFTEAAYRKCSVQVDASASIDLEFQHRNADNDDTWMAHRFTAGPLGARGTFDMDHEYCAAGDRFRVVSKSAIALGWVSVSILFE
jgi:hypothetical protein